MPEAQTSPLDLTAAADAIIAKKVTKSTKAAKSTAVLKTQADGVKRVRIFLEENDEIPPTGLFMSVNGVGYVLRPGEEADVPEFLLEVLDHAEVSTPRTEGDQIKGYKSRSRFPYRIITQR